MATKSVRLISWNINGIRAATKKGLVPWLEETNPLGLTGNSDRSFEVWVHNTENDYYWEEFIVTTPYLQAPSERVGARWTGCVPTRLRGITPGHSKWR